MSIFQKLLKERFKSYFTIIDYTGSATRLFADPDFDGFPTKLTEEEIDEMGETVKSEESEQAEEDQGEVDAIDTAYGRGGRRRGSPGRASGGRCRSGGGSGGVSC